MKKSLLVALICLAPAISQATPLIARGNVSHEGNVLSTVPFDAAVVGTDVAGFTLRLLGDDGSVIASLFQDLELRPSDIGGSFSASATTPGFDEFVSLLTDGTAHKFLAEFWVGGYGAGAGGGGIVADREYDGFHAVAPPGSGPDLAGQAIGRIEFWLDESRITWTSSNAVETSFSATYSVYAPVPEPSTVILGSMGLIVTFIFARRHRSQTSTT